MDKPTVGAQVVGTFSCLPFAGVVVGHVEGTNLVRVLVDEASRAQRHLPLTEGRTILTVELGHKNETLTVVPAKLDEAAAAVLAWFDRGDPLPAGQPGEAVQQLLAAGWLTLEGDSHRLAITLGGIEALARYDAEADAAVR